MVVEKRSFVRFDTEMDSNGAYFAYNWRISGDQVTKFLSLPEETLIGRVADAENMRSYDRKYHKRDLQVVIIGDHDLARLVRGDDGDFVLALDHGASDSLWKAIYPEVKDRALKRLESFFFPAYDWATTPWYFLGNETQTLYKVFDGHVTVVCADRAQVKKMGELDGFRKKEYSANGNCFYTAAISAATVTKLTDVSGLLAVRDSRDVDVAIREAVMGEELAAVMA